MRGLIVLMAMMLMVLIISMMDYFMPSAEVANVLPPMQIFIHDDMSELELISVNMVRGELIPASQKSQVYLDLDGNAHIWRMNDTVDILVNSMFFMMPDHERVDNNAQED